MNTGSALPAPSRFLASSAPLPPVVVLFLPVENTRATTKPCDISWFCPAGVPPHEAAVIAGATALDLQMRRSPGWQAMPFAFMLAAFTQCGLVNAPVQLPPAIDFATA